MDEAFADFITFILAYWYGACSNSSVGTYAHQHVITPLSSIEMPCFSGYQRHAEGIYTERFAALGMNSFSLEIADPWVRANCNIAGWGKSQVDYIKAIGQLTDATSLTLTEYTAQMEIDGDGHIRAAGGTDTDLVAGATEAERLANIYKIRIQKADNTWVVATPSACTGPVGGPSVITFGDLSLVGDEDSEIYYISDQASTWKTPPSLNQESPLRLVNAALLVNGLYDGSSFSGGDTTINLEWYGMTITGENGLLIENRPDSDKVYATRLRRSQRILTFQLSQEMRDCLLAADIDENDTISLQIDVQGDSIGDGYKYGFRMMVPKVGILQHSLESKDKQLAQKGDLIALEDATYGIGKTVTWNKTAIYLG